MSKVTNKPLVQVGSLFVKVLVKGKEMNRLQYDLYTRNNKTFFASMIQKSIPVISRADVVSATSIKKLKKKLMSDKFSFAYTYGVEEDCIELEEVC